MEKQELDKVLDSLVERFNHDEKFNSLEESIKKFGERQDSFEDEMKRNSLKLESNVKTMDLILNSEDYKNAINSKRIDYSFEVPFDKTNSAGTILQPTFFESGTVQPMREGGVDKPQVAALSISSIIPWTSISSNTVEWVERSGKTNGAAMRAEGSVMGQGDVKYRTRNTSVKIISEYMKATRESIKDVSFLQNEINSELLTDIRSLLDTQLLSGDGTGNNLLGITNIAEAWTGATTTYDFNNKVTEANEADVLRVGALQILMNGAGNWMPNYILMNPVDIAKLDLLKISDGRYIEVPFYNKGSQTVARVPIVANTRITSGTFIIGDFTKYQGFYRDGLEIRLWDQNSTDPIYNLITITGNVRVASRVKYNDYGAFVYGTFSTAKAALETP